MTWYASALASRDRRSQLLPDRFGICVTYLRFYAGVKRQGEHKRCILCLESSDASIVRHRPSHSSLRICFATLRFVELVVMVQVTIITVVQRRFMG